MISLIGLVVDFCFTILNQCFNFLASVKIFAGVTLFQFVLALVILTVVIFGLLSTVKISSIGAFKHYKRHSKE